jgi:hypothetical protein
MGSCSALSPFDICRPHLAIAYMAVRIVVYRTLGVFHDAQTLEQLNCAKRKLFLRAEFGRLNVTSLELGDEYAHYALLTTTLANMIADYGSESLGPMYGIIRQ